MIALTEQQLHSFESSEGGPLRMVNPKTNEIYILLRTEEYDRLKGEPYDDSPWTTEELSALAWQAGLSSGWEEMDEYKALELP